MLFSKLVNAKDLSKYDGQMSAKNINQLFKRAASENYLIIVEFLFKNGADIHYHNDYALRISARRGHLDIVKFLIKNGANINVLESEALIDSSTNGHYEIVKVLIENGASIHTRENVALKNSVHHGYLFVVELLLSHFDTEIEHDIDFYRNNRSNLQPLTFSFSAQIRSNIPSVKLLIGEFINDQKGTINRLRKSYTELFVNVVLVCDGYMSVKDKESKIGKFMNIMTHLPMELQMKICNNVYGINKENIPSIEFEGKLKYVVKNLIE